MKRVCVTIFLAVFISCTLAGSDDDVAGPVVKLTRNRKTGKINAVQEGEHLPPSAPPPSVHAKTEMGQALEQKLQAEFTESTKSQFVNASELATELDKTTGEEAEVKVETVVRISAKDHSVDSNSTVGGGKHSANSHEQSTSVSSVLQTSTEQDVDRAVASDGAEFVLSKPGDGDITSLTLDPQLITDLTCLLSAAAVLGAVAELLSMPTMNGYLLAGALVGPGGLAIIKELVQVETLAQLGVSLLLFGLGMELSPTRLRATWGVAVVGGALQVGLAMALGAVTSSVLLGASASAGAFVGSLLAMSSTSIVVKCLEATRSTNSMFGQIIIGTLITQDCLVGLLFALAPVFRPSSQAAPEHGAANQNGAVALLVIVVLGKLVVALLVSWLVARTLLRLMIRIMRKHASHELQQLLLCTWCFLCAWLMGKAGLSSELGAFMGGAMVAVAASVASDAVAANKRSSGSIELTARHASPLADGKLPGHHGSGGVHGAAVHAHGLSSEVVALRESIESVGNIMACLFLSSIGLLLAPNFLWRHIHILALGQVCLVVVKGALIGGVVKAYGTSWRTAVAVGVTMAHVGEFAFILLSMGWQLGILSPQVYELLLGITALSLLTTPLIVLLCARLLRVHLDPHPHFHHAQNHLPLGADGPGQYSGPSVLLLPIKNSSGLGA